MTIENRLIGERYRILNLIGEGGMGSVYKGLDVQTDEPVAIKLLKKHIMANDADVIERFQREGEALRQLNHPNIVKMLATVEEDDDYFLVMEYVAGGDLRHHLQEAEQLPLTRILAVSLELADALTRAHHLNIIHRDLKPANVLIAEDGTLRLTDFGVAYIEAKERVTDTGVTVGTLDYLSPEVLSGQPVDNRSDIWAFGVMLFEMLSGQLPFEANGVIATLNAIATHSVPDLEALCPDAPIALIDLIYRMLEKNRDSRIRSVRLVGAELEAIMQGVATSSVNVKVMTLNEVGEKTWIFKPHDSEPVGRIINNLPTQITAFIGREKEIEQLTQFLFDADTSLITILASGGMGKSRLALEMGDRILKMDTSGFTHISQHPFADGVFFVDLAPLRDSNAIALAIADSMDFHFRSEDNQIQQLVEFLDEKKTLLILDNFEHLLDGVGVINDIMTATAHTKILVTSRERLKLQGETILRLEGMRFPEWDDPAEAMEYSATRLFLQSAQRGQPGFTLKPDDLAYVAEIFHHVEGMPLGIVMAAAWTEVLSLPEIVDEISQSLDFLETDSHNVPERHRSIRAVFQPTWERLTQAEKDIFMKLSIFRGGFSREAAQYIAKAGLKDLTVLLNKALLSRNPNTGRYGIHELLRQYAQIQLHESSEDVDALNDLHCIYYANALEKLEEDLLRGKQLEAATLIYNDFDNLRAMWEWACTNQKWDIIHKLYFPLFTGSMIRNLDIECLLMAEQALSYLLHAEVTEDQQIALAIAYNLQSAFALRLGQVEKAKTSSLVGNELMEKYDVPSRFKLGRFMFGPSFTLGIVYVIQGQFVEAESIGARKLEIAEQQHDQFTQAAAYYILMISNLAQGKYQEAYDFAKSAHDLAKEKGHIWFVAYVLDEWANTARALGHPDEARQLYLKSLEIHKRFNDAQGMGAVLNHLGSVTLSLGQLEEAKQYFLESVALNRKMGNLGGIAESLEGLGNTMLRLGNYEKAEQYFMEALSKVDTQLINFVLSILIGLGELCIITERQEKGCSILRFVMNYPGSKKEIIHRVEETISRLDQKYDSSLTNETETGSLEEVINDLLEDSSYRI